jgi:hypothetical protein
MDDEQEHKKSRKPKNANSNAYVNVNRGKKGYKDKYKVETDKALHKFKMDIGKPDDYELEPSEWKTFFKTILITLMEGQEYFICFFIIIVLL